MASIIAYLTWLVVYISIVLCLLLLCYRYYGDTPVHRSNVLQLVGGIVIVIGLYYGSLFVLHQDKLVKDMEVDVRKPQRIMIVDGFIETPLIADVQFNTLDPRAASYLSLPRSYNRQGGAQFTYQFWMFVNDTLPATVANKMIMMRGDTKSYRWSDKSGHVYNDIAIACPSISFGDTFDQIKIGFNTLDVIGNTYVTNSDAIANGMDGVSNRNLLKLTSKRWVLYTVVFEDNTPINEFEDGIKLRLFVNDVLYDYATYAGQTLRQNNGPLVLFPKTAKNDSGGIKQAKIGNLAYYNYAQDASDVKQVYDQGPPSVRANIQGTNDTVGQPLYLSEYNKLDIYNS